MFPSAVHEALISPTLVVCAVILAVLVGVKWDLRVGLICTSLMINGVEPRFMRFLATCVSSSEKGLFRSLANFFNWVVFFMVES